MKRIESWQTMAYGIGAALLGGGGCWFHLKDLSIKVLHKKEMD
jgi:hypothetical protein